MTALENVVWEKPKVEVPREGPPYNRPLVKPVPGAERLVPYTRCTTFVGVLEDQFNLGVYYRRKVARGLSKRPDLLLRVSSLGDVPEDDKSEAAKQWKKVLNQICEDAIEADGASAAATIGTSLHALCETADRGLDLGIYPAEYHPHIEAYQRATAAFTPLYIEQFMVHDGLKVGGTPDRILDIPGHDSLVIGDIKTGSMDWGQAKMSMQLSLYAHSCLYDPANGMRTDLDIDQERGLIIALDAKTGECELKWIDIKLGWEGVHLARDVRAWRQRRKFTVPYDEDPGLYETDLVAVAREELIMRINNAESPEALVELWRMAGTAWTPEHTTLAAHRKAELAA